MCVCVWQKYTFKFSMSTIKRIKVGNELNNCGSVILYAKKKKKLDNLPRHQEKTAGNRNLCLQKDTESTIDWASKVQVNFDENDDRKNAKFRIKNYSLTTLETECRYGER